MILINAAKLMQPRMSRGIRSNVSPSELPHKLEVGFCQMATHMKNFNMKVFYAWVHEEITDILLSLKWMSEKINTKLTRKSTTR